VSVEPVVLTGDVVVLEPLQPVHAGELGAAVSDGRLWELWYTSVPSPEGMRAEIDRRLAEQAAGRMLPFTVRRIGGPAVGMTTYMNIERDVPRLEIGSTWTAASAQRTAVNPESKLLMLGHAFETLGCIRVEFQTDARNKRSRNALSALPANFEGIQRKHMRVPGLGVRDSAIFSIVDDDWPQVKANLTRRLIAGDREHAHA
jgi:N-acetyltransferase